AFPLVDVAAALVVEGQPLSLKAEGHVRARSGTVEIHGSAGPTWLQRASEILGRDVTYYAQIDTPPDFSARATFASDLQFAGADFRLTAPPLVARKVALDRARVRGYVSKNRVRLDHLEFSHGSEWGRGTYDSDFHQRDYRFRLKGSIRPEHIAGWFGPWWGRFWKDYEFRSAPPQFNIDALGNWLQPNPILITGSGSADDVVIRGQACDSVHTHLFIRPNYFDLFNATIMRPEGRLDGSVSLRFAPGQPNPIEQHFAFSSNA